MYQYIFSIKVSFTSDCKAGEHSLIAPVFIINEEGGGGRWEEYKNIFCRSFLCALYFSMITAHLGEMECSGIDFFIHACLSLSDSPHIETPMKFEIQPVECPCLMSVTLLGG